MGDYTYDPQSREWQCTFYFQVFDNFGLDDEDLLKFQGYNSSLLFGRKLASWWILQKVRNYKPFRTEIRHVVTLKGDLDE